MATKTDFTRDDWDSIRNAPYLVGAVTMLAGNSGITGTFAESYAVALGLYTGLSSGNALLHDLSTPDEAKIGEDFIRSHLIPGDAPQAAGEKLETLTMETLDKAIAALNAKGGGDVAEYKRWIYDIANRVANASKEGTFLGFGGERISDGEAKFLSALKAKLQIN